MDQQTGQVNNLLEDGWFFGNTLKNKSKPSKNMVRCNSDPSCSSTKEETLVSQDHNPSKMNNTLLRTPSLPVSLRKDRKYELLEEEEDDDEPRMGDLIRQAMPMPRTSRRLDRTPSLPPCRGTNDTSSNASNALNVNNGAKSCREVSVELSPLLQQKGPVPMVKLTRRASIDSTLLPPKCTSKGTKQSGSNSKNRTLKKLDQYNMNKSHKSLSYQETEELQGFKDLGFSVDNCNVSPNVTQILPRLQRRASLDSDHPEISKVRRPYLYDTWQKPSSPLSGPPSVPKWADQKASSSQDMKAQIKFWARAVASNVRQEC